jgi:hypothetical protein
VEATESDLAQSNDVLRKMGDDVGLAAGLVKQGDAQRLMKDPARAASLYGEAASAAERAGHAGYQADALSGKALAESSNRQMDDALRDAQRAVPLAQASGNTDALSSAFRTITYVHTERKNFSDAEKASKQQFQAAAGAKDEIASYTAYMLHAAILQATVVACDFYGDVAPCLEALDGMRTDCEAARAVAMKLEYPAMAKMATDLLELGEKFRTLIANRGR